jgi:hypothetical protein
MSKAGWTAVAALLLILAATVSWAIYAWTSTDDVSMSGHGWIAMSLGIVFSLAVGIGLMSLVFYSSRRGYDEPNRYE